MKTQRLPAPVLAAVLITILASSARVAAQAAAAPGAPPTTATAPAEPVQLSYGSDDILKLSRAKVNDEVTLAYIKSKGLRYQMNAAEIVHLRKEGVSDRVLAAMLNEPGQAPPAPVFAPPPAPVTETAPVASAPQYVADYTPAPVTTVVETVPVSTVYAVPAYTSYYSFYDPWPYWSWYPAFALGFYWGDWDDDCHDGDHDHHGGYHNGDHHGDGHHGDGGRPHDGQPGRGNSGGRNSATLAENGRPTPVGGQSAISGGRNESPQAGAALAARSTTSGNGITQPAGARSETSFANANPARSAAPARPTSTWSTASNTRTTAEAPTYRPNGASTGRGDVTAASRPSRATIGQPGVTPASQGSRPTSVWSGNASPNVYRSSGGSGAAPASRPIIVGGNSASTRSSASYQTFGQPAARPTTSYQRSSGGSSFTPRINSSPSYSRPSMSSSASSFGGGGSSRNIGSLSGASRPSSISSSMSRGGSGGFSGGRGGFSRTGGGARGR